MKFSVHIHNLLRRLEHKYTTKNPLTEHIKNSCPLIFECAVGVANCLSQMTGYRVDEDEIAYIALHIGGNLETWEKQKDKLGCILLSPQYYDLADIMMEKLEGSFSADLVVKTVITKPSELKSVRREELVISTIALEPEEGQQVVQVNPFLHERDLAAIRRKIAEMKQAGKRRRLREMLLQITSRELFHEIFDNLIVLLLEYQSLERVLASGSYVEFIESILECEPI